MTGIEMNDLLKTNCPQTPARMDLLVVDECPNCNKTIGIIRRIKANTIAINTKCGHCASTLKVSTISNEIKVITKGKLC